MDRLDEILTELDEPARLAAALGRYLEIAPRASASAHAAGRAVERSARLQRARD